MCNARFSLSLISALTVAGLLSSIPIAEARELTDLEKLALILAVGPPKNPTTVRLDELVDIARLKFRRGPQR